MGWTALEPIVKRVPHVKASISVTGIGVKLHIIFSDSFLKQIGTPKRADIFGGDGENVGKARITFQKDGKFEVKAIGYGGARIIGPVFAGIPDGARDAEECTVISESKLELIIQLPVVAWEKQIAMPTKTVVMKAAPKETPVARPNGKLDLVAYLTKSGYTVMRMSASAFKIDRENRTINEAVTIANKHLHKAGLPPVGIDDVQ